MGAAVNTMIATFARHAPAPRPYRLRLIDDLGPLLPRADETPFMTWPERIDPADIPAELRELARQTEMALRHPAIAPECRLTLIGDNLRALAERLGR